MTIVRLENVSKIFPGPKKIGPVQALDQVSLIVREAQTMVIVGPSGGGKSTLLRIIAGRELKYSGDVFFDNRKMNTVRTKDRYLSLIFQDYALYPHFKGRGRFDFLLRKNEAPDEETEERVSITAKIMGLNSKELLKRKTGRLADVQQQRLAIGRAIVRNPDLLLFDEPLVKLDAKDRVQTRVEIKRLLRQFRLTTLFVTHDQTEALALGSQIAVLNEGRIEQSGTAREVYQRPANTFVAGFLGLPPMNLFTGGSVAEGSLRLEDVTIPLPDALCAQVQTGQQVILGIRPEEIMLVTPDQPQPDGHHLQGTVETVQPDFARNSQLVNMRTGPHVYTVRTPLTQPAQPGEKHEVIFPFDQISLFDNSTQQRL